MKYSRVAFHYSCPLRWPLFCPLALWTVIVVLKACSRFFGPIWCICSSSSRNLFAISWCAFCKDQFTLWQTPWRSRGKQAILQPMISVELTCCSSGQCLKAKHLTRDLPASVLPLPVIGSGIVVPALPIQGRRKQTKNYMCLNDSSGKKWPSNCNSLWNKACALLNKNCCIHTILWALMSDCA